MSLKFGEIAKQSSRSLEDETDYTPKHQDTLLYKLGLVYKTLDQTWGTNTSQKVYDKLEKNPVGYPADKLKNVTCNFFTQAKENDPDDLIYLCKVTFSVQEIINDEYDEKKFVNQYKGWPKAISNMMKSDAKDYNEFKVKIELNDVTKKMLGQDIVVQKEWVGSCAPSTSTMNITHIPKVCKKVFFRFTKIFEIIVE